jgi:hypothetical protein
MHVNNCNEEFKNKCQEFITILSTYTNVYFLFTSNKVIFISRIFALGSTHLLTNVYHKSSWGYKAWPARKAENFNAICESIVCKM